MKKVSDLSASAKIRIWADLSPESIEILDRLGIPRNQAGAVIDAALVWWDGKTRAAREYQERVRAGEARNRAIEEIEEREREKE